jgi:hypothetical protein
MSFRFPLTIFLSAFLLFQVQPMMGRYILPWFGGTPAVWSVCLLFFQGALLAGYAYAHWLGSLKNARAQAMIHIGFLAASLAMLPVEPSESWKLAAREDPSGQILLLLVITVGGPYFLLSSTTPLVHRWFSVSGAGGSGWRLYALSNFGSFLGLFSYPFLVEPYARLRTQSWIWSGLYVLFVAFCTFTAWRSRTSLPGRDREGAAEPELRPSMLTVVYWLILAATGSALLLATTNLITQDIVGAPFLWVVPLSLYLLSFILTFESDRWYHRLSFAILAGVLAPVAAATTGAGAVFLPLWGEAVVYLAALFAACMVCHAELRHARPGPRHLTAFYLTVSAGGVLGGAFVAVVAPRVFNEFTEYPMALAAACTLGFIGWLRAGAWELWTRGNFSIRIPLMALLFGTLGAGSLAVLPGSVRGVQTVVRNFFGVLWVVNRNDQAGEYRQLTHGRIKHGSQYVEPPLRNQPTSYFGPHGGAGVVMNTLKAPGRSVAIIGLGAGTMAAWGRPGDTFRFYEINPDVEIIANTWFTYLKDSKAKIEVALGDARVQMERELVSGPNTPFDLIVVDAFSSDAIPMHLLTAECAGIYKRRLKPGGMILMHISNRTLNLEPVVRGLAQHLGWRAAQFLSNGYAPGGEDGSRWILLTPRPEWLREAGIEHLVSGWSPAEPLLWTDDFASLWHILMW